MRLMVDPDLGVDGLYGVCTACWQQIHFELKQDADDYYEANDVVNKWMDHQLNDCKPPVIDNPGGIGYSDFVTTHPLEDKVGVFQPNPDVEEDDDEEGYEWDEEEDEDDDEDDDDLK